MAVMAVVFIACNNGYEYKKQDIKPAQDVTNLQYTADDRAVTLSWTLPAGEDVIALQVVKENDKTFVETQGAVTSYLIEKAEVGVDLTYTVRVITASSISKGASITFYIEPEVQPMPAMLLLADSPEQLPDDDEQAAAAWFKTTYVDQNKGYFIKASDLTSMSINDYSMLFVLVDRVGIGYGVDHLPAELTTDAALNGMKKYLADGGNIFFAKMATQLVSAIGRIEATYNPGIFGDGEGGTGDDTWCMNAHIGVAFPDGEHYDHRSHPIFQQMEASTAFYDHEVYPLLGPGGFREDHNCMWDCNAYGFSGDPTVIKNFEETTTSTVLATWGHVVDYCCAGVVEFHPIDGVNGTIIANGMSAYEFLQNNQENQYASNIYRLTENTINYLSKLHD